MSSRAFSFFLMFFQNSKAFIRSDFKQATSNRRYKQERNILRLGVARTHPPPEIKETATQNDLARLGTDDLANGLLLRPRQLFRETNVEGDDQVAVARTLRALLFLIFVFTTERALSFRPRVSQLLCREPSPYTVSLCLAPFFIAGLAFRPIFSLPAWRFLDPFFHCRLSVLLDPFFHCRLSVLLDPFFHCRLSVLLDPFFHCRLSVHG